MFAKKLYIKTKKIVVALALGFFVLASFVIGGSAVDAQQSSTNAIKLAIVRVKKDGVFEKVNTVGTNNFKYDGVLDLDDQIRYSWNAVNLSEYYINNPAPNSGYLKIYLNDDTTEDNLITTHGYDDGVGLPVSKIADKLDNGENKILFVYIDSKTKRPVVPYTKVLFTFNFKSATSKPEIKVISPEAGAVFARGIDREFEIELSNFQLEKDKSGKSNRGKLNFYYNEISPSNLLGTIVSSVNKSENIYRATFDSEDYDNFSKIPDGVNNKLIFVLTDSDGKLLNYRAELPIKTNYKDGIDVGLPKVEILEPNKERSDITITEDTVFRIRVDNFEVLETVRPQEDNESGVGYLQIVVSNQTKRFYGEEFTLKELGIDTDLSGVITIKVDLVNKDFTKLVPEASDSVSVVFKVNSESGLESEDSESEQDIWRIVIMVLTVTLIIGSIAVLITKG